MDNTLALLHNSSTTRGLPHKLTRNLSLIRHIEYRTLSKQVLPRWNPKLPANSPQYSVQHHTTTKESNKESKREKRYSVDKHAWSALGHVVAMAEGTSGMSLGKIRVQGKLKLPRSESSS